MSKIKYIRSSRDGARAIIGIAEDEQVTGYYVSRSLPAELSLYVGCEVDEPQYDAIAREDESYRAMKCALKLLSLSDNTASALYMKLLRRGFCREVARECADECIRLGYIDEHRQLARLVEREANVALRGKAYIIRKLASKGYRAGLVREVIDELVQSGEVDFSHSFERLAEKMSAESEEERRALSYKYGYSTSDID